MLDNILKMFRRREIRPLETQDIGIKGMTCRGCAQTIKKALLTKNGVKQVYVDREKGVASVTFDPGLTDVPTLHQIILRKGYFPAAAVK